MQKRLSFLEPPAFCEWCGSQLPPEDERVHNKTYCTPDCLAAHYRELRKNPVRNVSCAWCGTEFQTTDPRKRCCTPRCANLDHKARTRPRPPARTCPECGTEFQPKTRRRVFCCHTCACLNGQRRRKG